MFDESLWHYERIILELKNPIPIVGYKFMGWYLDEILTKPLTLTNMPSGDITLYQRWDHDV